MTAALAIEGLSHSFGPRRALDGVSLSVDPGDFCALLGPNGAGKSTLFALATRLFHGSVGRIAVFGHDLRRDPSAALARMGVVFQQPTLDLDLTVAQNFAYAGALHGLSPREARQRGAAELARVNLADRAGDRARALSGGQRRRVEVARALLHRPGLLLLDEPTVGLDIESRRALLAHVRRACAEEGLAVLWATHLIDEVGPEAKVIILHRGRVLAAGPAAGVGSGDLAATFDRLTK